MSKLQCKRCAVDYVRQSHRLSPLARVLRTMHMYPFRCQLCAHRFWAMQWGKQDHGQDLAEDKREFQRIGIRLPAIFVGEHKSGEGFITNLSIRGCTLETHNHPHHGAILSLTLHPAESLPPIEVSSAIVRSALGKRLGLEFLEIDSFEEERLRGYIETLIVTNPHELAHLFLNSYPPRSI